MVYKLLDITPTPDVLVALTRTPISSLDALSELVDNAIDSFRAAETAGSQSPIRQVLIEVPGSAEVGKGEGLIRVRDTGAGLSEEQIANAMRAGFSSKNHFDTLGLFGMGFNIATGKLGRVTRVISAREEDDHAVEVVLDVLTGDVGGAACGVSLHDLGGEVVEPSGRFGRVQDADVVAELEELSH